MSLHITQTQAEALAAFVCRVRSDWDHPGVMAAIKKARDLGPAAAVGAALCRLAENRDLRTPALLAEPGPHWGATTVATRQPPSMCPDHPTSRILDCQECLDEVADAEAGLARVKAALKVRR
jgi:hypothetical protein